MEVKEVVEGCDTERGAEGIDSESLKSMSSLTEKGNKLVHRVSEGTGITFNDSENPKSTPFLTEDDMKLIHRIESTGIRFDDVCGMDEAKHLLTLPLIYRLFPDHVQSTGFLLFGVSIFL